MQRNSCSQNLPEQLEGCKFDSTKNHQTKQNVGTFICFFCQFTLNALYCSNLEYFFFTFFAKSLK